MGPLHLENPDTTGGKAPPIWPDADKALADLRELFALEKKLGFDLTPQLKRLRDEGAADLVCEVDWEAALTAGHRIAVYKLHDRLDGALAALRAWDRHNDAIGHS